MRYFGEAREMKFIIVCFFLFGMGGSSLFGQFYNGHQMTFGKNRVQYNDFYWSYYRFERFDIYFNQDGNELALYAETVASPELDRLEGFFDYIIEKRIIFIVYNKLTDFRQGNIGLITGIDEYNTGGVTRIIDNKVFLYFEGDRQVFDKQIRAAIAEIIINEMTYGSALRTNMAASATVNIPEWYHKGLISYISEPWSVQMDDRVKDGIVSGRYDQFTRLTGDDAVWAGHSFWRFIEKEYGPAVISNIVYITRLNKSVKNGFLAVLGSNLKELTKEWQKHYTELYADEDFNPYPDTPPMKEKPKKNRLYDKVKISPDGRRTAYVTNDMGQYRIWIHDLETGKHKKIFKNEHKLDQIQDCSYPVLAWHPSGEILLYIYEEKGGIKMTFYDITNKEYNSRKMFYFEKINSIDFSPDGGKIVMSAYRFGRSDIFVHTLASGTNQAITDDIADDHTPRFIENGTKIIFSSNRADDTLRYEGAVIRRLASGKSLFVYDYLRNPSTLIPLADELYSNQTDPVELGRNRYTFLGDQSGIINRYETSFDSIISHIDTAVHYRYTAKSRPLTDYSRNILGHDINVPGNRSANLFLRKGRYSIYDTPVVTGGRDSLRQTAYRKEIVRKNRVADSIEYVARTAIPAILLDNGDILTPDGDTVKFDLSRVNIYRYVFEVEKLNFYRNEFELTDFQLENDSIRAERNKIKIYQTAFYPNYLVSQVDFSFLETSYQAYTGNAVYYNPGFNLLFKLGANDLFEDYKIIGGVRFGLDFESNEYLLSFENLKRRLDRQIIFHRQAYENYAVDESDTYYPLKTHTHELFYSLRYPFSQTLALKGTASFRDDRTAFLSTNNNMASLSRPNFHRMWAGLKLELIFDNTRKIGINIPSGWRYKLFGESYWQLNEAQSDLYVLGADFRHYQIIHRNLIWASRFAASSSFGKSRLLYYLGSVDNWITFLRNKPIYDRSVRVDHEENYAYQTLATNMRGFIQNIRNGNNFALMNNEIRWPFVQYFSRYPMSNFWSSLQLVGFLDVGTAWSGVSPFRRTSAYDYEYIYNNSNPEDATVKITIETGRDPVVFGYGFGLRAQLLGYFMRFDWAWGVENRVILPNVFYFSMSLDF
jgi:WD40 repeat protein